MHDDVKYPHFSKAPVREVVAVLVLFGCFAISTAAFQSDDEKASGASGLSACSFLDPDLVKQVSGSTHPYLFNIPPEEEPAGAGSACFYADIILQIDAFSAAFIEQTGKSGEGGWKPVNKVGDHAYFRDNQGEYAEIIGSVGTRTFTIQLDVPSGSTAEAMKPNVITLANAIVAKLK